MSQVLGQDHLTLYSSVLYPISFQSGSKLETSALAQDSPGLKDNTISSPAASSLLLCSGEASSGMLGTLGWTLTPSHRQHIRWMFL